jgi:prevent-host-death family protein
VAAAEAGVSNDLACLTSGPNMVSYMGPLNLEDLAVSLKKDIRPVTYLKTRASDLLRQVNDTQRPVIITQNGEPRAVLQDAKSYEDMRYALGLLKLISQGEEDVRKGNSRTGDEVFSRLAKAVAEK